jgi:ribosomal protein S18 acetylase RimI-like enzyme
MNARLHIRPLQADDRVRVAALFAGLSPASLYQRFHSAGVHVDGVTLDYVTGGQALVAELDGRLVGLASYYPDDNRTCAELSIVVDDGSQRRGIGTALCLELLRDAQRAGIRRVLASVMRSNRAMLRLLSRLNVPLVPRSAGSVLDITIPLVAVRL